MPSNLRDDRRFVLRISRATGPSHCPPRLVRIKQQRWRRACPLWVISGHSSLSPINVRFRRKADITFGTALFPLISTCRFSRNSPIVEGLTERARAHAGVCRMTQETCDGLESSQGNWKQMKGKVKEKWGNLTDDDLDKIAGRRDQLEGKIQERYGIAKDQAKKDIDTWYNTQTW